MSYKAFGTNLVPYVGPQRDVNLGSAYDYPREFVPLDLPNGWRNVIDALVVDVTVDYSTPPTAGPDAEDGIKSLARILIEDSAGKLYNCTGEEARINMIDALGRHAPDDVDPGDDDYTSRLIIPFSDPRLWRPKDTALPVDVFRREDFVLRFEALSAFGDFDTGTAGSVAFNNIKIRVIALCHGERGFEGKVRRVFESQQTEADDRFPVTRIAGRKLLSLALHKSGSNGGASLANITKVDSQVLGYRNVNDEDLELAYQLSHGRYDSTANPFDDANAKAFPLIWTAPETKISQLRVLPAAPEIEVTESSAITSKRVLKTYLTPPSVEDLEYAAARRGVDLSAAKPASANKPVSGESMLAQVLPVKVGGKVNRFRG